MISTFKSPGFAPWSLALFLFSGWAAITLTDVPALARSSPSASAESEDMERARLTIERIRNTGIAIMSYMIDLCGQETCGDLTAESSEETEASDSKGVDWKACPKISYEELEAKLVPLYITEIPKVDGWGTSFEYCLQPLEGLGAKAGALGVRSPGSDLRYDYDVYKPGAFPHDETYHDVLWMDGFFVTWPGSAGKD